MSGPKTSLFAINSHFLGGSVSGIRRYNDILLPALFTAAPALLCQKDKRSREGGGDAPACFPSTIFQHIFPCSESNFNVESFIVATKRYASLHIKTSQMQ